MNFASSAAAWTELADAYQPGDMFFAFPGGTVLGQGRAATLAFQDPSTDRASAGLRLQRGVADLFAQAREGADAPDPIVMGAVPFDIRAAARLVVPRHWQRAGSPGTTPAVLQSVVCAPPAAREDVPTAAGYEAAVADALQRLSRGDFDKVVLARALDITLRESPASSPLLRRLVSANAAGYTFAVGLGEPAADEMPDVLLGASPELLVRRTGTRVVVNPLAGSIARHADPDRDAQAARRLAASDKDAREHALVIDAVAAALRPLCRTLDVPAKPALMATDALWHLSTTLTGELADPATTSLDLALALHPTPAVCGWPVAPAFDAIQTLEPFDRGFFAGFVGWCDAAGDGEWAVTLRCARWQGRRLRLFAGAGIVPGSAPVAERAETGTKFRTMLSALGLDTALD